MDATLTKPHISKDKGYWVVKYPGDNWPARFHFLEFARAAAKAWDKREDDLVKFLAGQRHILFS